MQGIGGGVIFQPYMSDKLTPADTSHQDLEKRFNMRLKTIADAIPSNFSVLDVACGRGRVLHAAIKKGCQGRGIDIKSASVEAARMKGLDVIEGDVDLFGENSEVHELMFAEYDVAIFSKCLEYLKKKNELMELLNVESIIVFQKCPCYWKFCLNNRRASLLDCNEENAFRLKGGEIIEIDSPQAVALWGASYGFKHSKTLRGGFWHRSMIVMMSHNPL